MAALKDVRMKIAGVGKTKQITKAMNMVASARLRGAQGRMEKFRAYADAFRAMLRDIASADRDIAHPLLEEHDSARRTGIVLATSDRGLCGSFNGNLIAAALEHAARCAEEGKRAVFYTVGRKGRDAVRKAGFEVVWDHSGSGGVDFPTADRLGAELIGAYLAGTIDEAVLIYGGFVSLMRQEPEKLRLLPLSREEEGPATPAGTEHLYEPAGAALLEALLPRVIKSFLYKGLLNTATSEQAARMTAMDNATRNCDELIRALTRLFNKTRQAAITSDLIDIVGGANALNG
jgi:F-type H+-transporting ATPase subunit gamma